MLLKKFGSFSENQKITAVMVLVGVIALIFASNVLHAFFLGEDEALFIRLVKTILDEMRKGDFRDVFLSLLYHDHPPLPILMAVPFVSLMGYNEAALRMPNVLLWAVICMVAARVGWRLAGLRAGLLTGIFLAISGLFDIDAMGFGLVGEILFVLLLVNLLLSNFEWNLETPDARKKYLQGGIYLAIGYLFFTSILPVIGIYHLLFAYKAIKYQPKMSTLWKYMLVTLPIIGFYLIDIIISIGIPAYDYYIQGSAPYGQLMQNLGRGNVSHLNFESLLLNLRIMNWYAVPFISWGILAAGIYYQFRKNNNIFIVLVGFGSIWSFYLFGNTGQHFLSYFCWLAPFGIAATDQFLQKWKGSIRISIWAITFGIMLSWTYVAHIKVYSYDSYPRGLVPLVWGENLGWINNIYRPVRKIAGNLDDNLGPNAKYISTIDGALSLYYFPDEAKYLAGGVSLFEVQQTADGQCLALPYEVLKASKVRAVVSYVDQIICSEQVEKVIRYPGSNLQLTILKR